MAPFIDGGRTVDRTNWSTTVISYYPFGGAIALALDLTLRDRSDGRAVARRLHARDVARRTASRAAAAKATSIVRTRSPMPRRRWPRSAATRRSRAISSRATSRATRSPTTRGCWRAPASSMKKRNPGRAWLGDLRLESRDGARVAALVPPTWPIYAAGLDEDDELQQIDGQRIASAGDIAAALQRHKPGDSVPIVFVDRTGAAKTASVTLTEDPHMEVVPVEWRRADRRRRRRSAIAGWERNRCRFPGCRLIDAALGVANFAREPEGAGAVPPTSAASRSRPRTRAPGRPRSAAGRRRRRRAERSVRSRHAPAGARARAARRRAQRAERALRLELQRQAGGPRDRPAAAARRRRRARLDRIRCCCLARRRPAAAIGARVALGGRLAAAAAPRSPRRSPRRHGSRRH